LEGEAAKEHANYCIFLAQMKSFICCAFILFLVGVLFNQVSSFRTVCFRNIRLRVAFKVSEPDAMKQLSHFSPRAPRLFMSNNPKPSGYCSTKEGKAKVLHRTKQLINESAMIFCIPYEGVSKENTDILRKSLPAGVTASVVKNSLMRKSVEGTPYEPLAASLSHETMFFFVPEALNQPAYFALKAWQKEIKRQEAEHLAKAVITEGQLFNGSKLEQVLSLPSKQALVAQVASLLQSISLRLTRTIKAIKPQETQGTQEAQEELELGVKEPQSEPTAPTPPTPPTSPTSHDSVAGGAAAVGAAAAAADVGVDAVLVAVKETAPLPDMGVATASGATAAVVRVRTLGAADAVGAGEAGLVGEAGEAGEAAAVAEEEEVSQVSAAAAAVVESATAPPAV
jgi:large subunit ribosomal protein L10